jgi:flagellar hook assembly protein FlgD
LSSESDARLLAPTVAKGTAAICYVVGEQEAVDLSVLDGSGRIVRQLVRGRQRSGVHSLVWDRSDEAGRTVASGIYFCRFRAGDFETTKKMLLIE